VNTSGGNGLTLDQLVPAQAIELDLSNGDKGRILDRLLATLEKSGVVNDRVQVLEDLLARESQGSTALGRGVALPHAKTVGAEQPVLAFGRYSKGVDFHSLDGEPVYLVFLFLSPRNRPGFHLRVLAALNRFLREKKNRQALIEAAGEEEIRHKLHSIRIG
jgi:mannitol/fructose-specific phosphotransferase system IIA component (Ntr-type)